MQSNVIEKLAEHAVFIMLHEFFNDTTLKFLNFLKQVHVIILKSFNSVFFVLHVSCSY